MDFLIQLGVSYKGELAALGAALLWAGTSTIYLKIGRRIAPLALNLAKSSVALILLGLAIFLLRAPVSATNVISLVLLLLSGALSIGLGDTAYFIALNRIGARRTLLFDALTAPITALLALVLLHESINATSWLGILLVTLGVAWVASEQTSTVNSSKSSNDWYGVFCAVFSVFSIACAVVLSRAALEENVSPLLATLIRFVGAVSILLLLAIRGQQIEQCFWVVRSPQLLRLICAAALIANFFGGWLQQVSLTYTSAGIAQTLFSTTPLFIIPISVGMGEQVSIRGILGGIVAVIGVWLVLGNT